MTQTDPRAQAAFDAAINHIKTTTSAVADRVADHLGLLASAATRIFERDALVSAQIDLRRHMSTFVLVFADTLSKRVTRELNPDGESGRNRLADTDWQSLSLVDDSEVEEQMFADRIAQVIAHECEWELREVASYAGALLGIGRADNERNPLRAEVLGNAIYRAIVAVSKERESRKLLAREIGSGMARVMPTCYSEIVKDMRVRGVQPAGLTVRGVEGPGSDRMISGYNTLRDTGPSTGSGGHYASTSPSEFDDSSTRGGSAAAGKGAGRGGSGTSTAGGGSWGSGHAGAGGSGAAGARAGHGDAGGAGNASRAGNGGPRGGGAPSATPASEAELMTLIRRLTALATRPSELDAIGAPGSGARSSRLSTSYGGLSHAGPSSGYGDGPIAVNLIRAHRDELRQASSGTLDHMVIDVVGSLFDQILSDPRVPPQMARQIARLQLPVLRVALNDTTFFSSRKHPVRRFVNRIASLACAFDEFDEGPGKQFLERVRELVQEIVAGDFDQLEVYGAKLNALEGFIAQQAKADVQANASAVSVVDGKESDLRVQQRYMLQLQAALNRLSLPEYLRDFLAQVWSQALALATRREGAQSETMQRLKRAGRDLVMSVQPKGSPAMRKKFLLQLPTLMKDLNEGMALIGWPDAAQKNFFAKLLPAHAESLKGQPLTELEYNLLAKQLEAVFNTPVPEPDALLRDVPMTSTGATALEPQFSDTEAQQIGLVTENSVDWSGKVDIDLTAQAEAAHAAQEAAAEAAAAKTDSMPLLDVNLDIAAGLDINLDLSASEPAEPSQGAALIDHVKLGFAYQMHLNEQWQKVRLSYVSPGRAFFVFTRGKRHHETVSLTARMLARMCETGRFKAFESSYLIERATARARKQLAALSPKPAADAVISRR